MLFESTIWFQLCSDKLMENLLQSRLKDIVHFSYYFICWLPPHFLPTWLPWFPQHVHALSFKILLYTKYFMYTSILAFPPLPPHTASTCMSINVNPPNLNDVRVINGTCSPLRTYPSEGKPKKSWARHGPAHDKPKPFLGLGLPVRAQLGQSLEWARVKPLCAGHAHACAGPMPMLGPTRCTANG